MTVVMMVCTMRQNASVPTLLAFAIQVHIGVGWQVNNLDKGKAGQFAGAARGKIIGIARNP
jgi:hypothetical protein